MRRRARASETTPTLALAKSRRALPVENWRVRVNLQTTDSDADITIVHRFGPIGWTLVLVAALVTGQPIGPTLLGAAIGYAVIFRGVIADACVDTWDRLRGDVPMPTTKRLLKPYRGAAPNEPLRPCPECGLYLPHWHDESGRLVAGFKDDDFEAS